MVPTSGNLSTGHFRSRMVAPGARAARPHLALRSIAEPKRAGRPRSQESVGLSLENVMGCLKLQSCRCPTVLLRSRRGKARIFRLVTSPRFIPRAVFGSHTSGLVSGLGFTLSKPLNHRAAFLNLVVGWDFEKRARLFAPIDPCEAVGGLTHSWITLF